MNIAILIIGAASLLLYLWRRRWFDALLVLVATAALFLLATGWKLPGERGTTLAIDPAKPPVSLDGVRALSLSGDGLRAAQWQDLPARPLDWKRPTSATLRLDFPRRLALGRMFRLTVLRGDRTPARLQLLAENGQVLAEARGSGNLTVQWLPPLAETLELKARLFDDKNTLLAEGPVPVVVEESPPLKVSGRFSAPSFDLRVLNELLAGSHAVIDWQVALGKAITRSETAREKINKPDLLVVDAAWFERAPNATRSALLDQVKEGVALLVLGGNANDSAVWSRTVQLPLRAQAADATVGPLALSAAPLNPAAAQAGAWAGRDGLWSRQWGQGRIGWLGAADWHRQAIKEPRALALWWQDVLDALGGQVVAEVNWLAPEEMPLPGQRLEVCAQGVQGRVHFPDLEQTLEWRRRGDRVDASCVAVWPRRAGWLRMETQGAKPVRGQVYVHAPGDWPLWQAAERRDATARYAARTLTPATQKQPTLPGWPFGLVFALAMLCLWWRERR